MTAVLLTSSILILVIAALRPILRGRFRPLAQYALWLMVAVRLLVPVELASSAFSALALLERAEEPAQLAQAIGQTTVPVPAMSYEAAYDQALREYHQDKPVTTDFTDLAEVELRAKELQLKSPTLAELAAKYAKHVWLSGAAVMGLWFLLVNLRLRRKLKGAKRLAGVDCPLPVYVSGALPSPCLCGILRPAVYVIPAAMESPDRLRHVLAHELTHYRHRDHWWALVRCVCLCLYWFDPLVWWAAAMSRQDCELACDEGAIRRLGEGERISYGRTLVAMIAAGRNSLLQTATTMTGGRRRVRERVKLIARRPKSVIALVLTAALVLGLTAGFTFTGAPAETQGLPAGTLRERLADIPEELRFQVVNRSEDVSAPGETGVLASYWWDVPADWEQGQLNEWAGWLLSVYQFSQEEFMADLSRTTSGRELFARSGDTYFVIAYPGDGGDYPPGEAESYHNAYGAIRAYAVQQVLDTEGVEPFGLDGWEADPNTLTTRILTVPETLNIPQVNVYPADDRDPECLAAYWLSDPKWVDLWSGYLLSLYQCSPEKIEENVSSGIWSAGVDTFARSGDLYYSIVWPDDGRYQGDDEYWNASNAIRDYIKAQVLATQGVEPVDNALALGVTALQERLLDLPEELRDNVEARAEGGTLVVYYFKHPGEAVDEAQYLLNVSEITEEEFRQIYLSGGYAPVSNGQHLFAKGGDCYYRFDWNTSIEYDLEDEEQFTSAFRAVREFAMQTVLAAEGVEPFDLDAVLESLQPIWTAANFLYTAPSVELSVRIGIPDNPGQWYPSYPSYTTVPSQDFYGYYLNALTAYFNFEPFDWGTTDDPQFPNTLSENGYLSIMSSDYEAYIRVQKDTDLVEVHDSKNGTNVYHAQYAYTENGYAPTPFAFLRRWYDTLELDSLRPTSVPDRGQSHEEIAREWAENWEIAMTQTVPDSPYTCTYVRIESLQADYHDFMDEDALNGFAQSRGLNGADYKKTWFTFIYNAVVVPVDQSTSNGFWEGNTAYYEGDDAPEGALIYGRVGIMRLTDEGWTCDGTGTGF